jgi:hypothetical protein
MLKSFVIFKRNGTHLVKKKDVWKNKDYPFLNFVYCELAKTFLFVLSFECVNFVVNEKYSKRNYDNLNYYASLMIFQTYKNVVLRSAHSFGWLLWIWFYFFVKVGEVFSYTYISKNVFKCVLKHIKFFNIM